MMRLICGNSFEIGKICVMCVFDLFQIDNGGPFRCSQMVTDEKCEYVPSGFGFEPY